MAEPDPAPSNPRPAAVSASTRPTVAIVGRPNVGKSAIFNRLIGRRISIVHDEPGVTRDRISAICTRGRRSFELIDTGGIGSRLADGFSAQVRLEADIAIESASMILFVVDAQNGLTPVDQELASVLRKSGTPVILLVNKVDTDKHENLADDFARLGFENPLPVSAEHDRNFDELTDRISDHLIAAHGPETEEPGAEPVRIQIAIVGRPNVGKSSLLNAILEDERTIVSDVAGTTRDAIDIPYERGGRHYTLIDTAGIRRRTSRDSPVEVFSVMRSEKSIRRADLCLLVIDASRGVTAMDRTIGQQIVEAHKPCIIVVNKFDLYEPELKAGERLEKLRTQIERELFFLHYAPFVATSAMKGQHLNKIFGGIEKILDAARQPIGTGVLNRFLQDAVERNPPPIRKSRRLNLLYVTTRKEDRPRPVMAPRFLLFVNYAELVTRTFERYLENELRKEFDLTGMPIAFSVRSRQSKSDKD
jgi:GTP-binding protein